MQAQLRRAWENDKWVHPVFLASPLSVYIENVFRLIRENQLSVFSWWNEVLELREDSKLELIDPENMRLGFPPDQSLPAINISAIVETIEDDNSREDTVTIFLVVALEGSNPSIEYKVATIYLNALQSLFEAAPPKEFMKGWPPVRVRSNNFLIPSSFRKFVKVGTPTSDYIAAQVGTQPVLTLELVISPPHV